MKEPTRQFAHMNQYEDPKNRMACTIFSSIINLLYNTGIDLEDNVDELVNGAIAKGILNVTEGGSLEDNFMFVYSYAKKLHPELKYEIFNKDDSRYDDYINKGMMVRIGITVNRQFTYDSEDDGIIEAKDYMALKGGDIRHATNEYKWLTGDQTGELAIWDSYFGKKTYNDYAISNEIKDVLMNNCYIFYID